MKTVKQAYFIDKELSWLAFNARVLQEAADPDVPIIERVRFLGIFSNNQDEFFRVRFAEVKRLMLIHENNPEAFKYAELLTKIQTTALSLQERFEEVNTEILWLLARRNIFLINESQISEQQGRWLKRYFQREIIGSLVPILVDQSTRLADCLQDNLTYLAIEIRQQQQRRYAVLEIPADDTSRFVQLPKGKDGRRKTLILLDNVIRYCLADLFEGILGQAEYRAHAFKVTRDAEYNISNEIDESLAERLSEGLKQRLSAMPVRFVYDREMPTQMLAFLTGKLRISSYDSVIPGGRYHNYKDFMFFPAIGSKFLLNKPLSLLNNKSFDRHPNPFEAIAAGDILLHYPYHAFHYFTEFVRQAAFDPKVSKIKISVYRVASKSQLISSLIDAAKNNKDVTVIVELRARFDEAANIEWARRLKDAGVRVEFGHPNLKVHTKICLIERNEAHGARRYAHIGTGNFHEGTARVYTDLSLFTCQPAIAEEVDQVFDLVANMYKRFQFRHLLVSPHDTRKSLVRLIKEETGYAKAGHKAEILIKTNNLTDEEIIRLLYKASQAGVKIRLIIRGMCSLVPGVKGMSDNIRAISIIDRFLEHPRIWVFKNQSDPQVFISSADIMPRNLDNRIEVSCPIYDPALKKRILDILEIQWKDTTKARIIDQAMSNTYVRRGNRKKLRSQIAIHEYLAGIESKND